MLHATPQLQDEIDQHRGTTPKALAIPIEVTTGNELGAQKLMNAIPTPPRKSKPPMFTGSPVADTQRLQTRVPVILGEAKFRGTFFVDGLISGLPGHNGGATSVRQHGRSFFGAEPEFNGEISFVDMIRVNGHIAGSVQSTKGTLIVDTAALVDANVDVAIAVISGTVTGDIVAHQRVELAPSAKIYGNIWTRSLAIQSGAIFEGVCQMLEDKKEA